jgi:hypothetical protein
MVATNKKLREVDADEPEPVPEDPDFGGGDDYEDYDITVQQVQLVVGDLKINVIGVGTLDEISGKALDLFHAVFDKTRTPR